MSLQCPHISSPVARQQSLEGMRSRKQEQLGSGQRRTQMLPLKSFWIEMLVPAEPTGSQHFRALGIFTFWHPVLLYETESILASFCYFI